MPQMSTLLEREGYQGMCRPHWGDVQVDRDKAHTPSDSRASWSLRASSRAFPSANPHSVSVLL